ncbi:MAG: 30S ribosomal protein S12 methylthiotransferase RimO [Deltaproteobacteria bacterium]|nr:30S ribosomal protein S12 methylthiotransferase RimO [Deltaproteobacteria bacterium]
MSSSPTPPRVYFRTLGCAKNQVDSEVMLGSLALGGYAIAEQLADAEVAIVNTCSFIQAAREESIQEILELADCKQRGELQALVVAGCLPQRYGADLAKELPEVDAFVGTGQFQNIARILDDARSGRSRGVYVDAGRTHLYDESSPRLLIGARHSAYLKIAEGCDRVCAFCAIPAIRGRFQSRTLDSIVAEARQLAEQGVREVNVISQDTLSWGKDLDGRPRIDALIRALDAVDGLDWVRLLYLYPSALGDAVIDAFAGARRVLPYIDVPLQHASDSQLRAMKRGVTAERQRRLVARLRERIPGAVLRTTFIVGFPGETDADFETLCEFVRETRFERVGVFRYSDEEGTSAQALGEKVARSVSRKRHRELMKLQRGIMREQLSARIGESVRVLVDSGSAGYSVGRTWSQAPEVDGCVMLRGRARTGELVNARITGVRDVDLEAEVVS